MYVKAVESRSEKSFLKALMTEQPSIAVDPRPTTDPDEEEFEGVRVTLVYISSLY